MYEFAKVLKGFFIIWHKQGKTVQREVQEREKILRAELIRKKISHQGEMQESVNLWIQQSKMKFC